MPISDYLRGLRQKVGTARLLVPAVTIVCRDAQGRVLLARHHDYDQWAPPGGSIDPGETPADAAVREMWEETGLLVEPVRVQGIYGGPTYGATYPNGDQIASVDTVFECRIIGGVLAADGEEIQEVRYFTAAEVATLALPPWAELTLTDLFAGHPQPCFQAPVWTPPADGIRKGGISDYVRDLRGRIGHELLLLPAVAAFVFDHQGHLLLQQRADTGRWGLPVGGIEPDETPADAVLRETWEETGVLVKPQRVIGVYGGPTFRHTHANGDQTASIVFVFQCTVDGGTPSPDGIESLDARFFPLAQARDLLAPRWQARLDVALQGDAKIDFAPATWQP